MKENKFLWPIIIISSIILVAAFIIFILPWLLMFFGINAIWLTSADPTEPEITRAEFNITLEYEEKGEKRTVHETMVCEYEGIGANTSYEKCREWSSRLKSGEDGIVMWSGINNTGEEERLWYCYDDNPGYYMGDPDYQNNNDSNAWCIDKGIKKNGIWEKTDFIDEEDTLFKQYGITIIGYECDPPIANSFD